MGIVFIYPEEVIESNRLGVYFSHQYEPVKVNMKKFKVHYHFFGSGYVILKAKDQREAVHKQAISLTPVQTND